MKRYLYLIAAFSLLIVFLIYNVGNWQDALVKKEKIQEYITKSYELKAENQAIRLVLSGENRNLNRDSFTKSSKKLLKDTNCLITDVQNIKNKDIQKLAKVIKYKSDNSAYLYEDYKSINAVINNSILWLKEIRKQEFLRNEKERDFKLITFLSDIILAYYEKTLQYTHYEHENKLINQHIKIINKYFKRTFELEKEFDKYDIDVDLTRLISDLEIQLQLQDKVVYNLMLLLFASAILLFLVGTVVYISEIQARNHANKLRLEFKQFVDALNESAIVSKTDLLGNITYVNDKFCEITDYTREELIGKPHSIVRHPDMPKKLFVKLWKTIQNKKIFKATIKNRMKDGTDYYVDSVVIPLLDQEGDIAEYMAVRYDVTELVHSRDKAVEAQKIKDEFLSNMSHELRTPLNAILGFSQILQKVLTNEKHKKYIDNIHKSSKHLLFLINEILDLSKIQSGKFVLSPSSFNIQEELPSLLSQFEAQAKMVKIDYVLDIDKSTNLFVDGDWIRISQVINNLLSNAIKFTPENGSVKFHAHYADGKLYMCVTDSGIGMSQEVQDKIFQPFVQADSSITRKYGGTGLGLSITNELLDAMKGTLQLKSEEGKGTEFTVEIPLAETSKEELEVQETEEFSKLKGKILVAEDNVTNQLLIKALLEKFDLECDIAEDGEIVVSMFNEQEYDLILMDENMPKLTGLQAMKIIKENYKSQIPIIAVTANNMAGDKEKFLKEGMDGFIGKPIDEMKLYKLLLKYLGNK
jgi:PAS domain S-box-containing protein